MKTTITKPSTLWLMLFSRLILFVGIQALLAFGFYFAGSSQPWEAGANWWPFGVTLANLICIALLMRSFRAEGKSYWNIFRIRKENILGEVLIVLGLFLIGGPLVSIWEMATTTIFGAVSLWKANWSALRSDGFERAVG